MSDFIYDSRYQNLHMDRANFESMKTINITIDTSLPSSSTPVLLYEYEHGYNYKPQFWGLWDINYMPKESTYAHTTRGYGIVYHNTGFGFVFTFYYNVTETSIELYALYNTAVSPTPDCSGTTATFTGYLFANGRNSQTYGS